jgi:hypothetical protein
MKNGSFTELWYRGWISCYDHGRECKPAEGSEDVPGISADPFLPGGTPGKKTTDCANTLVISREQRGIETGKDFCQCMKYQP